MRFASVLDRVQGLGADKWDVHFRGRDLAAGGAPLIELTIGEPDRAPDPALIEAAVASLRAGRTRYSDSRGEPALRRAVADHYARRAGRAVSPDQVLAVPGTQTALYVAIAALAEAGDEVAMADPSYATYEGVVRASGAAIRWVPLDPDRGFRLTAEALDAACTPATRVLLLNSPHNPTGTVLTREELAAIAQVCIARDLAVVSDEVYEPLVFDGARFASIFDLPEMADRTLVVSSISKSHAAPGFRSGWIVGSADACARMAPLVEMVLFGNQPFLADATALALTADLPTAGLLRTDYARRAAMAADILAAAPGLSVLAPQAGMFLMLDVRGIDRDDWRFAHGLLEAEHVSVMPGAAFGRQAAGWVRLSLTVPDERLAEACRRIVRHAGTLAAAAA